MAFMGFWGTGVEPGTQYTEKVSCTVWKMMMMKCVPSHDSNVYKIMYRLELPVKSAGLKMSVV